jgi:RNA polymerase sigma factor (TIGR02999 family)
LESAVPQNGLGDSDADSDEPRAEQTPGPTTKSLGADQLFASLYAELHRMAESHLRSSGRDLAVSTTTLVHDMWLDMSGRPSLEFPDRTRFMAYASRAMRAVVIDYARRARAQKRGGGAFDITLHPDVVAASDEHATELERLSDALDHLATINGSLAELVDLHFFCGFAFREIAELRDISERTVRRDWRKARLLLHQELLQ